MRGLSMRIIVLIVILLYSEGFLGSFVKTSQLTHASMLNVRETERKPNVDVWVVGAGTLGSSVAKMFKDKSEQQTGSEFLVVTETRTHHNELSSARLQPRLRSLRSKEDLGSAKNVLISIPPTALSDDAYIAELLEACDLWAGPKAGGKIVYISSTAVYGDIGGRVIESSPVDFNGSQRTKL